MVFYRKYRPQTIAELDSEEIRQKLYSVFSDLSSVPHAYLFTGPKGLGKTSAARIVAKVVNCERKLKVENGKLKIKKEKNSQLSTLNSKLNIEPGNKCDQGISITNGTNLDILEIDGASNRGIDEIRDLREKVRLLPVSSAKKIYIIDEVHMLTTEAFNALLKTLEEPPAHVIFILCTTEPQKVPETIVSRCFHISFKLATQQELLSSFTRIAKKEKLDFEKEALSYIAEMSDGSFRDGVKILDELAKTSIGGNGEKIKITKDLIEQKYQVSSIKYQVLKLLEYLEKKDAREALKLVSDLVKQGVDMKYFIEKLVSELHSILLRKVGAESILPGDSEVTPGRWPNGLLPGVTVEELKSLIELFTKAYGELKYAVLPQLPLELAVIEWGIRAKENKIADRSSLPHVADDTRRAEVSKSKSSSPSLNESQSPKDNLGSNDKTGSAFSSSASGQATPIWQDIILKVKSYNHSLAGILRSEEH